MFIYVVYQINFKYFQYKVQIVQWSRSLTLFFLLITKLNIAIGSNKIINFSQYINWSNPKPITKACETFYYNKSMSKSSNEVLFVAKNK